MPGVAVPHGFSQCALQLDKATPAALKYLTGDPNASLDGWDHLIGICYSFVRDLFLRDDFGSYTVEGVQHDELTGLRNNHQSRREGTLSITRNWIQEWLLTRLDPYHGKSLAEVQAAVDRGEFRYLGRQCRNALIDKLRKAEPTPKIVPLDPGNKDQEDAESGSLSDSIGTWNGGGQSSLDSSTVCREDLLRLIAEDSDADGIELTAFIDSSFPPDGEGNDTDAKGDVTRLIAERRGVNERQARTYKQRFLDTAKAGKLQTLCELLRPLSTIVRSEKSKIARANRLLRSQALEDLVLFERWCRESGRNRQMHKRDCAPVGKSTNG
jgi:hypothetical protein